LSLEAPNLDQLGFKYKSCGGLIDLEVGGTIIVRNCQERLAQQHSVTSQKAWTLITICVRTSNLNFHFI